MTMISADEWHSAFSSFSVRTSSPARTNPGWAASASALDPSLRHPRVSPAHRLHCREGAAAGLLQAAIPAKSPATPAPLEAGVAICRSGPWPMS